MKKGIRGRAILILTVTVLSFLFFLPSTPLFQAMPQWWKKIMPSKAITLGLDLQGGMHLILKVEGEKAVENYVERAVSGLKEVFSDLKFSADAKRSGSDEITVTYSAENVDVREDLIKAVEKELPGFENTDRREGTLIFSLPEDREAKIASNAISQALETIRNRIDQFGVLEPLIQKRGKDQILIQLPGVKDPQRAIDLIGKTALLEFKLVNNQAPLASQLPVSISAEEEASWLEGISDKIPEGSQILFEKNINEETGRITKTPYLVEKRALIAGDSLTDAHVNFGDFNQPVVSITFDREGGRIFEKVTGDNIDRLLAIILDNNIYSTPRINQKISGGQAEISGQFLVEEARDLALVLRAGALPAPVEIIQNLTVGPSLGQDSIDKGFKATLLAVLLVVLFMVVYYRVCGIIADFALLLNVIVLIGALAAFDATLTLPGIAGIILTIGMGVDSNVLIFERIREELRQKKPVRLAVDSGYDKAFVTIVDSHVTTLLTGAVLFLFGTGPIKGFAVTLCLGIGINLFTALVGTKVLLDLMNNRWKLQRLSI